MSVFLDSSALVKRYADEPGAELIRSLGAGVACAIARVEVPAAIWRKHRIGELEAQAAATLVELFEWEWLGDEANGPLFVVVAVTDAVLDGAARDCAPPGGRAYPARPVAAARGPRAAAPEIERFACFDRQLADAAHREGFALVA